MALSRDAIIDNYKSIHDRVSDEFYKEKHESDDQKGHLFGQRVDQKSFDQWHADLWTECDNELIDAGFDGIYSKQSDHIPL